MDAPVDLFWSHRRDDKPAGERFAVTRMRAGPAPWLDIRAPLGWPQDHGDPAP